MSSGTLQSPEGLKIIDADIDDAEEILSLQKLCYRENAERIGDYGIPPLTQTGEEIRAEFSSHTVLKIETDGRIIASVRAHESDMLCHIGKLIVHPEYRRRGLGTKLMHEIERRFPAVKAYSLFTGSKDEGNLILYEINGYSRIDERKISERLTFVYLMKQNKLIG